MAYGGRFSTKVLEAAAEIVEIGAEQSITNGVQRTRTPYSIDTLDFNRFLGWVWWPLASPRSPLSLITHCGDLLV